jgi:hypothetical protein
VRAPPELTVLAETLPDAARPLLLAKAKADPRAWRAAARVLPLEGELGAILAAALASDSAPSRRLAVEVLGSDDGRSGCEACVPALQRIACGEASPDSRRFAAAALRWMDDAALRPLLRCDDPGVRLEAAHWIDSLPDSVAALLRIAGEERGVLHDEAVRELLDTACEHASTQWRDLLPADPPDVRARARAALDEVLACPEDRPR